MGDAQSPRDLVELRKRIVHTRNKDFRDTLLRLTQTIPSSSTEIEAALDYARSLGENRGQLRGAEIVHVQSLNGFSLRDRIGLEASSDFRAALLYLTFSIPYHIDYIQEALDYGRSMALMRD